MKTANTFIALTAALILSATSPLLATVQLVPVLSGLSSPVFVGHAGDGSNRLFIVERAGVIKVLQPGGSTPTVFLDIHTRVLTDGGEEGLLGLAFHPSYASNGRFFVYYTRAGGEIVIAEYRVSTNPNVADNAGETIILTIPHPTFTNHNGGMLAFDQDNYLRVGVGDGGSGNDPSNNAQNLGTLLGKILRLDVDPAPGTGPYASPATNPFVGTPGARPEIFAYGMRNPWRFSFDRLTHEQWVADVGQGAREEVDTPITNGGNYGWRVFEGFSCTGVDPGLCGGSGYIAPRFEYFHSGGRCSITGGYVYRGNQHAVPGGTYVYGDFCTGEIFGWDGTNQNLMFDTALNISSFGEDESGELYVVGLGGTVHKIVSTPATGTELLNNGDFGNGAANWQQFATPDSGHMVWNVTGGIFSFYRVAAADGEPNQAVVFQHTGWSLPQGSPVVASFDLGNTSTVRKRITVLLVDSDFSDLSACTFWLAPNAPLRTYGMRSHTIEAWTNAAIYFYAATTGSDGGGYAIDNVTVRYQDDASGSRTDCLDPTAPPAQGGSVGADLVANGSFDSGLAPWNVFGQLEHQLANGVLEFYRPASAGLGGGLLQQTGTAIHSGQVLTAHFDLGNSSLVRKRVTVLLHDLDFSDLSACTFWLAPGQLLSTYEMRSFTTETWSNATLSVYAATIGSEQWMRLDNLSLQQTPGAVAAGTECVEPGDPGGANIQAVAASRQPPVATSRAIPRPAPTADVISVVTFQQPLFALETSLTLQGGTEESIVITLPPGPCQPTVTLEVSGDMDDWRAITSYDSGESSAIRLTVSALRPTTIRLRVVTERPTSCSSEVAGGSSH